MQVELATLGGGCFWCLEAVFEQVRGVLRVESGYCGGQTANPTYKQVCSGETGHAEVVQVSFDPAVIPFADLLDIFFASHDPTTLNRQGADVGTQYRSVIFYHTSTQHTIAAARIQDLDAAGYWPNPIVTKLVPFGEFTKAEDYHQGYYRMNPEQAYCQVVIAPKLAKFRNSFANRLKPG